VFPTHLLIEMTAITSSYGAEAQYWHDDVPDGTIKISPRLDHAVFIQSEYYKRNGCYWRAQDRTIVLAVAWMLIVTDGFQVVGEDGHCTGDALPHEHEFVSSIRTYRPEWH
jgi:hypothetical protein